MEAAVPKIPSSEKMFTSFLLHVFCEQVPEDFRMTTDAVSKFMLALDPKSEANLYRKQYGNLNQCVKAGKGLQKIFYLDNTVLRLREKKEVDVAYGQKILSPDDYQLYLLAWDKFMSKKLGLMKEFGRNECVKCHNQYVTRFNKKGDCATDGDLCQPRYDWDKSEDVLKCEI